MGVISTHQLSTFSSPVNGTSPVDANQVRGNDNSIRASYNAHDADPTVHLQTGLIATRPSPNLAGTPWLATDTGAVYLWADTGSAWVEVNYLRTTGGTVTGNVTITAGGITVTGNSTITGTLSGISALSATSATVTGAAGVVAQGTVLQVYKDGTPTKAGAIGMLVPGGAVTNDLIVSMWDGSAWTERARLSNAGVLTVSAGLTVTAGGIAVTGNSTITGTLSGISTLTATTFSGALSGNATTATTLATPRAINGVNFDGSAPITVTAAAGTLTGATLAAGVTASSLTSVGILASPHMTGAVVDSGGLTVSAGGITVTGASTITGTLGGITTLTATTLAGTLSTAAQPNVTSVGTLLSLLVTGTVQSSTGTSGSIANAATFNAAPASDGVWHFTAKDTASQLGGTTTYLKQGANAILLGSAVNGVALAISGTNIVVTNSTGGTTTFSYNFLKLGT